MSMLLLASFGITYAMLLWLLARAVATQRDLLLGRIPLAAMLLVIIISVWVASMAWKPGLALATVTCLASIVCGVVDHRTGYIFDALTATSAFVALAFAVASNVFPSSAIGAALAGSTLGVLYLGTQGRGIGLGDVKLATVVGLGYGPLGTALAVGSAFVIGGCYGAALLATGRARIGQAIRFGPFLAGGSIIALVVIGVTNP